MADEKKKIGFSGFLTIISAGLALVALILYIYTMAVQENMLAPVILVTVFGIVASALAVLCKRIKVFSIIAGALFLLAALLFVVTQLDNIGYAITDTNIGDGIFGSFVVSCILYAVAAAVGYITVFIRS
jgi:hypothetical protein